MTAPEQPTPPPGDAGERAYSAEYELWLRSHFGDWSPANKADLLIMLDEARASASPWREITSAPKDTTQGDFLISMWNSRGDCCWVQIVRNPKNHHGLSIASHWMPLPDPPGANATRENLRGKDARRKGVRDRARKNMRAALRAAGVKITGKD